MPETATTPTPESGAPTPASEAPKPEAAQPSGGEAAKSDAFKSEESKQAVLADLAKERDARQALEKKFEDQQKAFAQALGLTEAPKSEDDLAETVKSIQAQLAAQQLKATRLEIAAEKNIPANYHDLLTETDTEKLRAQAEKVAALVAAANPGAPQNPAFQANPGQGQNGAADPSTEDAEYDRYYPS